MKSFKQHLLNEKVGGNIVDAKGKAFEFTTMQAAKRIGRAISVNPMAKHHDIERTVAKSSIGKRVTQPSNPLTKVKGADPKLGKDMISLGKAAALTIAKTLRGRGQAVVGGKQVGGNNSSADATDVSIKTQRAASKMSKTERVSAAARKPKEKALNVSLKVQAKAGNEKLRAPGISSFAGMIDHANSLIGKKSNVVGEIQAKTAQHETIERGEWLKHADHFKKVLGPAGKVNGQYSSGGGGKSKDVHWHVENDEKGKPVGVRMSRGASSKLRDFAKANPDHPAAKAYNEMGALSRKHAAEVTDVFHNHLSKIFAPNPDANRMKAQSHIYKSMQGSDNMPMVVTGFMDKKTNKPQINVHDVKGSVDSELKNSSKAGLPYARTKGTASFTIGSRRVAYDRRIQGGDTKPGTNGQTHYHALTVNMK